MFCFSRGQIQLKLKMAARKKRYTAAEAAALLVQTDSESDITD